MLRWPRAALRARAARSRCSSPAAGADLARAALLGAALDAPPRLGSEFLPELNEGALYITFTLPANISLTEGRKLTPRLTQLISTHVPRSRAVLSQLGRPEDGTDPTLPNNLEFFVKLQAA